jgi:hypothetical protein
MSFIKFESKKRTFGDCFENINPQCPKVNFSSSPTTTNSNDFMEEEPNPTKRIKMATGNYLRRQKTDYMPIPVEISKENMEKHIKNKKRKSEKLYTEDEVKSIVQEREAEIFTQYNEIVQNLLQEQYNSFIQFNQDQISRQFKERDFSYTS